MAQATLAVPAPGAEPSMLKGALFAFTAVVLLTCLLGGLYARQDERERSNAVPPTASAALSRS